MPGKALKTVLPTPVFRHRAPQKRAARRLVGKGGFSLIELLAVAVVIAVLAGLTVSTVGYANKKAAMDRARSEIAALEVALEAYKIDNGDYPRDVGSTDRLDALNSFVAVSTKYGAVPSLSGSASRVLYVALSADANLDRALSATEKTNGRIYFRFTPTMLFPYCAPGATVKKVQAIVDPFLNVYGYSTIGSAAASGTGSRGYNPTFDLWSTADTLQNGAIPVEAWIKNW